MKAIYEDVSEWLKFGEAKNAALTTFLLFIMNLLVEKQLEIYTIPSIYIVSLLGLGSCLTLNLCSYVPFITRSKPTQWLIKRYCMRRCIKENVVFYMTLACMDEKIFKDRLGLRGERTFLEESYIQQVLSVSQVAAAKYMFFEYVVNFFVVFVALSVTIGFIILKIS